MEQKKIPESEESMQNYVVTIARGFGTGGKQIALKLAEELNIECYENRILYLASQLSGVEPEQYIQNDERLAISGVHKLLKEIPILGGPKPEMDDFSSKDKMFDSQADIIQKLADTESCIIVGKCADYVLRNYTNVISVYIEAPRSYCVQRIMKRMHVGESQAHALISKTDKYRAEYYRYYTHGNYWTNPVNYDITLNSQRLGERGCINMIKHCISERLGIDIDIRKENKEETENES